MPDLGWVTVCLIRLVGVRELWPNRVLPAIVAALAARLIYVSFAHGPTSVLVVFGLTVGLLPTLYFMATHAVGLVYGLLGREPETMTGWFETGWQVGVARSHKAS
jgi:hypothetical protein